MLPKERGNFRGKIYNERNNKCERNLNFVNNFSQFRSFSPISVERFKIILENVTQSFEMKNLQQLKCT